METLSATANSGSTFAGWSGGGCTGTGYCRVILNSDTTVDAKFTRTRGQQPAGKLHLSVDRGAKVSGTTVSIRLGCHATSGASCKVLAILTTTERLQGTKVIALRSRTKMTLKVVTLAKADVTIAAGAQKTVSLSLNATGRTLLKRFHTLPARLTTSLTNTPKPTVILSRAVTFKQQKATRRR